MSILWLSHNLNLKLFFKAPYKYFKKLFKNLCIAPLSFLLCRRQEVMQQRVGVCVGEDAGQQRHHVHPSIGGTDGNVDSWHDLKRILHNMYVRQVR